VLDLVLDPWTSKAHSQRASAHTCKLHDAVGLSSAAETPDPVKNFWTGMYRKPMRVSLLLSLGHTWMLLIHYSAHLCSREGHEDFTAMCLKRGV